jgi:hypothetical protein
MDDSDLLAFAPVPLRARRDDWTAERQRAYIQALSRGLRPGRAARALGLSRQTAYALRRHPGGESFAAAWDAAIIAARRRRFALREPSEWERAIEGIPRPVRHRGRIVAVERRFDNAALQRLLGRVDRLLEKRGVARGDYFSLEKLNFCHDPRTLGKSAP